MKNFNLREKNPNHSVVNIFTHLPSEDVLVVDEAGGESLDGALIKLGELLAEQQGGLAVHIRARHLEGNVQ